MAECSPERMQLPTVLPVLELAMGGVSDDRH